MHILHRSLRPYKGFGLLVQEPIVDALQNTGLQEDCPFNSEEGSEHLTPESAREVPDEQFTEYAGRLNAYLQVRCLTTALSTSGLTENN